MDPPAERACPNLDRDSALHNAEVGRAVNGRRKDQKDPDTGAGLRQGSPLGQGQGPA